MMPIAMATRRPPNTMGISGISGAGFGVGRPDLARAPRSDALERVWLGNATDRIPTVLSGFGRWHSASDRPVPETHRKEVPLEGLRSSVHRGPRSGRREGPGRGQEGQLANRKSWWVNRAHQPLGQAQARLRGAQPEGGLLRPSRLQVRA